MVCDDWNPTPADLYETLAILAINKYAVPFDFYCPLKATSLCFFRRSWGGRDGNVVGSYIFGLWWKILWPTSDFGATSSSNLWRIGPSHKSTRSCFFCFFLVLRLFTKFRGIYTSPQIFEEFWAMWRDHLFVETTFDGQKIRDFLEFFLKLLVLVDG